MKITLTMECRNCGNEKIKFLFSKDGTPYFKCLKCHICFSGKVLDDSRLKQLYDYYGRSQSVVSAELNELRYDFLLNELEVYRMSFRLLDIGCGRGGLLKMAAKRGWKAIGCEFSQEATELCRKNNLEVICGKLPEINFEADYFDVICMQEVIEHVDEKPGEFFAEVFRILRPGGALYLTTPNLNSLTRFLLGAKWRAFHIEHRFLFTPYTLKEILKNSGFIIRKFETKNISLDEIKEKIFSKKAKDSTRIRQQEQILRERIEKSAFLEFLKSVANGVLKVFECGDTILVLAEKKR